MPAVEEDNVRKTWKEYFQDLYNGDTEKRVLDTICGFEGVKRCNCFWKELLKRTDREVRL